MSNILAVSLLLSPAILELYDITFKTASFVNARRLCFLETYEMYFANLETFSSFFSSLQTD